jgi:hypothetical protein
VLLSAALLAAGGAARSARAQQHVFWGDNGNLTLSPGFAPSMFLLDDNVAAVDQFLAGQGGIKALKLPVDLSPATISAIYNKYKIDYTFIDYETPDAAARVTGVVSQIKASTATGPAVLNNKAFVGNFGFAPVFADPTTASGVGSLSGYLSSGLNMATEELYPGSQWYRGPASGNSTSPNVRSALFTLPIERLSLTTANLPAGHQHVAYVDRFNNWQNPALDTDGDPGNGFRFVTQDQLLSRGDFQAQVLHYRLRGATAVHGLQGGVEGYTPQQFMSDIDAGWSGVAAVNQVLGDPKARAATLDTVVDADGTYRSLEDVGLVWSGAYSTATGKMVLLMSNLDGTAHRITIPSAVGGKLVPGEFMIQAGSHEILEFGATGTTWNLLSENAVFADSDRSGVGVPEPAALAAIGVVFTLGVAAGRGRRRSR